MSQIALFAPPSPCPWKRPEGTHYWNKTGWKVQRFYRAKRAYLLDCSSGVALVIDQSPIRVVWLDTPFFWVHERHLEKATEILNRYLKTGTLEWGRVQIHSPLAQPLISEVRCE